MKKFLLIFFVIIFTSCVSSSKFARTRYKANFHSAIHTYNVSYDDYVYVYNHSPNNIKNELDNKQLKIYKIIQKERNISTIFYCLVDANIKGQIGDRDVKFVIKRIILNKYLK